MRLLSDNVLSDESLSIGTLNVLFEPFLLTNLAFT